MWHLVVTSACFMIPAIRGFRKGKRLLPSLNTATSLVSMNYWMDPTPGWRRTMDFTLAKTNYMVHHFYMKPRDIPLDIGIGLCWLMSNRGGKVWHRWHAVFHGLVTVGMLSAP